MYEEIDMLKQNASNANKKYYRHFREDSSQPKSLAIFREQ